MPIQALPILIEIIDGDVWRVGAARYLGSRFDRNNKFIPGHDHQCVGKLRYGHPAMHNSAKDEEWVPIIVELHQDDEHRCTKNHDQRIWK